MASVTDIITYIGVPLAVVGVLPIIYTCIKALFTLRSIQHELKRNGLDYAVTRGSLMSRTIEVEIPRCSITPLERDDAGYWKMSRSPSTLRGGSWSIFNWNRIVTGRRLYRLQYADDLREPQAEVEFEELLSFLLDRGAVPDVKGLHKLRTSGLWTPIGTSLLLSPDTTEGVLKVALPDDSDGILSLSLQWSSTWDRRGYESLPPSWMRLEAPREPAMVNRSESSTEKGPGVTEKAVEATGSAERFSIRFHLSHNGERSHIDTALFERDHDPIDSHPDISHLQKQPASIWFALAASALGHEKRMGLWDISIPENIRLLVRKDSIPCGVLVLVGLLDETETPPWATQYDPSVAISKRHSEFVAQTRRIAAEREMPPAQAQAARNARMVEERAAFHESSMAAVRERMAREEKRILEGLNSPRLDNSSVAKIGLKRIIKDAGLDDSYTMQQAVESVLYQMVVDPSMAERVARSLDQWMDWTERGGMNKEHIELLKENTAVFCYASSIVLLIQQAFSKDDASVAADMQECMRLYRKVRLG